MTSMASTIHVQLFPTLPPDAKALEPVHRLHSTRTIRGAIPIFLDLDSKVDTMPKPPTLISPQTRAIRRKGQIFHSKSPSMSSIESDYVSHTRSESYHSRSSPSSSQHFKSATKEKGSGSGMSGKKKTGDGNPQILAQPFLLRLRSLPVPPTSSIKSGIPHNDQPKPLPPVSSSFNMDRLTACRRPHTVLSDDEKRKKLAKLTRTLGENVPAELVFHPAPQRSTSMVSRPVKSPLSHKPSPSSPLPIAESPAPQPQSTRKPVNRLKHQPQRSMTLTTKSAVADPRETRSFGAVEAQTTKRHDTLSPEWGRRKERDWSGEWNIKDMEHVAKALRGLKSR